MEERKKRSFVICCAFAGVLLLAGCGGDAAKKTLEGTWNCANFITVRAETERMPLTPVAFLGIPMDAIDKNMTPAKFALKKISNDSLEMIGEDGQKTMLIRFPDANTAEVSLNASSRR